MNKTYIEASGIAQAASFCILQSVLELLVQFRNLDSLLRILKVLVMSLNIIKQRRRGNDHIMEGRSDMTQGIHSTLISRGTKQSLPRSLLSVARRFIYLCYMSGCQEFYIQQHILEILTRRYAYKSKYSRTLMTISQPLLRGRLTCS